MTPPDSNPPSSTGPSTDTLTIGLSADAWRGDPYFVVKVDGNQLSGPQAVRASNAAGQDDQFTFTGQFGSGQHQVEVDFLPTPFARAGSSVLYVDSVVYDGSQYVQQSVPIVSGGAAAFTVAGADQQTTAYPSSTS
jgi:hypothetical protein